MGRLLAMFATWSDFSAHVDDLIATRIRDEADAENRARAYVPPVVRTYTLVQTADAGTPTAETIAVEDHPGILLCVVEDDLRRTATPGYRRELLAWVATALYAAETDPSPLPYAYRIPNGTGTRDAYTLTVTR